jgi:TRAP-type C4-dicarboxylate transport system substrate-binding protein
MARGSVLALKLPKEVMMRKLGFGRVAWLAALLGVVIAMPALPALAQQVDWKMHIVWVPARPEAQAYQRFADLVNERAKGKLNIALHSGGSLGIKDVDLLRVLPPGNVIQIAGLYPGYMTRDLPEYAVTVPPGVIKDAETLVKILPALTKIYQETYDKWGIKLLGYVAHPVRDTHIYCKEPINSLAQLKGKKLRVWEKFHVQTFDALGVAGQVIGQNDLYLAMQTGVVDCAVYPIGFANTISLQEVAPNAAYLFPYVLHPLNLIVSKKAFDSLPADVQKVVQDAAQQVERETVAAYVKGDYDKTAITQFQQKGGKLLAPFSAADQAAFQKAARDVWDREAKAIGAKAQENHEAVVKAIGG